MVTKYLILSILKSIIRDCEGHRKSLSRKKKDSKNREKARIKVARIHAQITDSRKDHLHRLTTQLVRENQRIVVENLAVKNMVKKPKLESKLHIRFFRPPTAPCRPPDLNKQFKLRTAYLTLVAPLAPCPRCRGRKRQKGE